MPCLSHLVSDSLSRFWGLRPVDPRTARGGVLSRDTDTVSKSRKKRRQRKGHLVPIIVIGRMVVPNQHQHYLLMMAIIR